MYSMVLCSQRIETISVIGSGNWGTTIAKIIALNVSKYDSFETTVKMWVFDEKVNNKLLSEIINEEHENVKYLPGVKLPKNIVADPDLKNCTSVADILVIVLPHQFVENIVSKMAEFVKKNAIAISLIKGVIPVENQGITLISEVIEQKLKIPCAVLMGANLAGEVALEQVCEATIGCKDTKRAKELKQIFQADYFRVVVVNDKVGVELCGALKNVVALGAGLVEGLGYGENTKAATIRLGYLEMVKFITTFYKNKGVTKDTFSESCGIADLIATCNGGRNKKLAIDFAKSGKTLLQLEKETLNGQMAQGPLTAKEINVMLAGKGLEKDYPIFTTIHNICIGKLPTTAIIDCLKNHPVH